jgi:membrane carboxypeptidase/penicillin-binding protein
VAVWLGSDDARGKQTLGRGTTGGQVAVPIAQSVIEAAWNLQPPQAPLPPSSAEAGRHLKAVPINLAGGGQRLASAKSGGFMEYFRLDGHKKLRDTRYACWPDAIRWRAGYRSG